MALTPEYEVELLEDFYATANEDQPSKTWEIDFANNRIGGFVDDERALRQFIVKALLTERYKFVIYSDDYGNELPRLIGSSVSRSLLESEIPRMIQEALEHDNRIESVSVDSRIDGDKAYVTATVTKADGNILVEEVALNV